MKSSTVISLIALAMLCLLPSLAFAFEFSWQSPDQDKSLFYLGQIFGPVGTALPKGSGNAIISQLFSIFNIAVLTLGSIVVSYTIILSTINTAQEGEVMGRKWSSLWIPLRSAVGIAFLIPTASGYSLLQMLMMEIVVHGVAAANQVWAQIVYGFSGQGTGLMGTVSMEPQAMKNAASSLLNSAICANVLNNDTACRSSMGNNTVTQYQKPGDDVTLYIGVQGNSSYDSICGSISAATPPKQAQDASSWYASNQIAFSLAYSAYGVAAAEITSNNLPTSTNILNSGVNILQGNISSAPQVQDKKLTGANEEALQNGWLFAGSYYFVMISNGNNDITYPTPTISTVPNTAQNSTLATPCQTAISQAIGAKRNAYLAQSEVTSTSSGGDMVMPSMPAPDGFTDIINKINQPLNDGMKAFMLKLTTSDPRGVIPSLRETGALILTLAQVIWFTVMIVALIALIPACIASGLQPSCWVISAGITILMPILTAVIILLWGIGAMIGIYLPLVPYLVFTFTALGWFLLIIETIVAAPIVALGLVSPAGEHLGKAAPAVMLIVNVFLRPSLMVIGFALAAKLAEAMIDMLNYGFFETLKTNVNGAGLFGAIAILGLYGGTALAIIHECFSLIHILPDKIVRWLGGQAEQSQVKAQLAEAKKGAEKGAEAGGGMMKGASGVMAKQAKKYKKKAAEEGGESD
ncbi:MAG: DotA/TraY family protein [Proteobacteria bacterium]|nr:DotA/TraY family protein [Pseudomonadota bacterium]